MSRSGLRSIEAPSALRTIVPDSSIHTAIGMLMKPNSSPVTWRVSIRLGWVGVGGVDPLVACARLDVERHRHDGQALRLELGVQRLPPGQARAAASIAGPGDEQHLATAQRREVERVAVAVDQLGVRQRRPC